MGTAFFISSIFLLYAASFYFGGLFVYYDVQNDTYGKTYTGGDVMATFFGIIFGMFSLGMMGPNMKVISEGKAAAYTAF